MECFRLKGANLEHAVCHVTGNTSAGSLQSTVTPDDSNTYMYELLHTKSCAVRTFRSAFAGVYKQKHKTEKFLIKYI